MFPERVRFTTLFLTLLLLIVALPAAAQDPRNVSSSWAFAENVVIPQSGVYRQGPRPRVVISKVSADIGIVRQVATTTLEIGIENPTPRRIEAEILVPVPGGAAVKGFAYEGPAAEPTARLLPRDEARRTYDPLVSRVRDPALVEFVGYNLVRTSVFPVEAGGRQKVRLTYEEVLEADGDRVDYLLPRSESLDYRTPWEVSVKIKSKRPISTVYSPSHLLDTERLSDHRVAARIARDSSNEPGPFRLSYLLDGKGINTSLFSYPEAGTDGGYFLLLAGLPADPLEGEARKPVRRDITMVFDRSGSMGGEKIKQVREAALQVLEGLEDGDAVNLITFNESVSPYSSEPIVKNGENLLKMRSFLKGIRAGGGTNFHQALMTALQQHPRKGSLPILLLLTDGLPTVGQTSLPAIRKAAVEANRHGHRIFTFGVGHDLNSSLLMRIATRSRAIFTSVAPGEDVEVKVSRVFRKLSGPVLTNAKLEAVSGGWLPLFGGTTIHDMVPDPLPDLYVGDQLVLLGRYTGEGSLDLELSGDYLGTPRAFRYRFDLREATPENSFVPRLWATRRIAVLVEAIRDARADAGPNAPRHRAQWNPATRELLDEVVHLSTEFGILTQYTAFFADEGTDLSPAGGATQRFDNDIWYSSGSFSAWPEGSQSGNSLSQWSQKSLNRRNTQWPDGVSRTKKSYDTVRQVSDRTFYRKGDRWVDSRLVDKENGSSPDRTVEFGSPEFRALVRNLTREGRQAVLSMPGDTLLEVAGEKVLVKAPRKGPR